MPIFDFTDSSMRINRILFLASFLLAISKDSACQTRIDAPLPKIPSQVKGQLLKATGWIQNPSGQWISRQNRIPVYIDNQFKSLIDYEKFSTGIDNFISYQLREIKIQDSTYLILIKKYKDGAYTYPAIEKEWQNYSSIMFYVFRASEIEKLKQIQQDTTNILYLRVLYFNSILEIKETTYITDIENEISKQILEGSSNEEDYLVLHFTPFKRKNIVQFQIYSSYSKYFIISGINESNLNSGEVNFENYYRTEELLKHCYFETEYSTFFALFKAN